MKDELGDRMKMYEGKEAQREFIPILPILARLDGRAFHTFCHKMEKPFDAGFHATMTRVTKTLVEESNARVGYTQSDEISLLFHSENFKSQVFFNGSIMKMTSTLAAVASVEFNYEWGELVGNHKPTFDCRCWQLPDKAEVANYFLWQYFLKFQLI